MNSVAPKEPHRRLGKTREIGDGSEFNPRPGNRSQRRSLPSPFLRRREAPGAKETGPARQRPGDTVRVTPVPKPCQAISSLTTAPSWISFIERPSGVSIFRSGSIPS
jgi:hypothetical protein